MEAVAEQAKASSTKKVLKNFQIENDRATSSRCAETIPWVQNMVIYVVFAQVAGSREQSLQMPLRGRSGGACVEFHGGSPC